MRKNMCFNWHKNLAFIQCQTTYVYVFRYVVRILYKNKTKITSKMKINKKQFVAHPDQTGQMKSELTPKRKNRINSKFVRI